MKLWLLVPAVTLIMCRAASGQEGLVRASSQGFTFGDPAGVGLRSYTMTATTFGATHPVQPWLTAGATVGHAKASMSSRGVSTVDRSGMTDAEVFVVVRAGPVRFRGEYVLSTGQSTSSSEANVVAGVAAYELLPFPVRSWGRGGGYALEAVLPLHVAGFDVQLLAATRSHGAFSPFDDDAFEYKLGAERRLGLGIGRSLTALARFDVGAQMLLLSPDDALRRDVPRSDEVEVFEAGNRAVVYSLASFPVARTMVLLRGDLYVRRPGSTGSQLSPLSALIGGTVTARARSLVTTLLETRTPLRRFPILTTTGARVIHGDDGVSPSWLATAGVGTEFEVRGPWPGRAFLMPTVKIHRGRVAVAEDYESTMGAWEISVTARWEARR